MAGELWGMEFWPAFRCAFSVGRFGLSARQYLTVVDDDELCNLEINSVRRGLIWKVYVGNCYCQCCHACTNLLQ